ncbi:hypothetical protein [Clostridium butyricum]|nr:hypothetical protein [Clostridium butyricum]
MIEVEIVEPNISKEENERRLDLVKEVLEEIARDMQRKRKKLK